MGIYIKNMELPKSCWCCRFELNNMCRATIDRMRVESCDRHPDCPLIEVPKHGRLIDADALGERMHAYYGYSERLCGEIDDFIINAPTIIESEE